MTTSLTNIGWLCVITWQTGIAGPTYFAGTLAQGLFVLNIESYEFQRYHGSLLTLLFILVAILINTFFAKRLPLVEQIFVILHVFGIFIFIPLLVLSPSPNRNSGSPLVDFYNGGGWTSNGLSTMIGTIGPIAALIGFDCSVHMGMLSFNFVFHFSLTSVQPKKLKILLVLCQLLYLSGTLSMSSLGFLL